MVSQNKLGKVKKIHSFIQSRLTVIKQYWRPPPVTNRANIPFQPKCCTGPACESFRSSLPLSIVETPLKSKTTLITLLKYLKVSYVNFFKLVLLSLKYFRFVWHPFMFFLKYDDDLVPCFGPKRIVLSRLLIPIFSWRRLPTVCSQCSIVHSKHYYKNTFCVSPELF